MRRAALELEHAIQDLLLAVPALGCAGAIHVEPHLHEADGPHLHVQVTVQGHNLMWASDSYCTTSRSL
jgi:hypothetical protein